MNIGFLFNNKIYPPKAGGSVHAYQFVKNLTQRGHQISTWYSKTFSWGYLKAYRKREVIPFIRDIDLLYIRIHGKFSYEIFTLLKLLRFGRIPVVWEINAPLEEGLMAGRSRIKIKFFNMLRRLLARLVSAAVCTCDELIDYAKKDLGITQVKTIANGSDIELFSPDKRKENTYPNHQGKFKVVWAGTTYFKWHGVEKIYEIAKAVYEKDKDIVFVIVGHKIDDKMMLSKNGNILFLGPKEYLDMPSYLASADVGLCLYYEEEFGSKFYRSPLKLFDYMASGIPVVATKIGQIAEVVKDGQSGFLIEKNDIGDVVEKILFLKNNPKTAKDMGKKGREAVENYYNWQRVGEETEAVFKQLLNGKAEIKGRLTR